MQPILIDFEGRNTVTQLVFCIRNSIEKLERLILKDIKVRFLHCVTSYINSFVDDTYYLQFTITSVGELKFYCILLNYEKRFTAIFLNS